MQNQRVICRDWQGFALDRVAVGAGKRVIYVRNSNNDTRFSTGCEPVGFPREDVFSFVDGVSGLKLAEKEWARLELLQWPI